MILFLWQTLYDNRLWTELFFTKLHPGTNYLQWAYKPMKSRSLTASHYGLFAKSDILHFV